MNTLISYLYRDASNYKVWNFAVLSGTLSEDEKVELIHCMVEEQYFIPCAVGLAEKRFDDYTEDDQSWFELYLHGITETDRPTTVSLTVQQLLQSFRDMADKWEERAAELHQARIGKAATVGSAECPANMISNQCDVRGEGESVRYRFDNSFVTVVNTCALVEDYQILAKAKSEHDWEGVQTVMDCLAETLGRNRIGCEAGVRPSPSSLIAMSIKSGLLVDGAGNDFKCAAGRPVSSILDGGVRQCDDECSCGQQCIPEECVFELEGGFVYSPGSFDDEELLKHLETL